MTRTAFAPVIVMAATLALGGACRAGDNAMTQEEHQSPEAAYGLWRIEGATDRCRISLQKTPAGPGAWGVLVEGCEGSDLAAAVRWRLTGGAVEILDGQGAVLSRLQLQGPDVLVDDGLRLTRAPEA